MYRLIHRLKRIVQQTYRAANVSCSKRIVQQTYSNRYVLGSWFIDRLMGMCGPIWFFEGSEDDTDQHNDNCLPARATGFAAVNVLQSFSSEE
jgi:hypothetical protein